MSPQSLPPLVQGHPIVDPDGSPTAFYLLRWQDLINSFTQTPTKAAIGATGLTAALSTTTIWTTLAAGDYQVGYYIQKTAPDGVSSSLTVTLGWTANGQALTRVFSALTLDSLAANQGEPIQVYADGLTDITIAVAYASNTPGTMTWLYRAVTQLLA